LHGKSSHLKQRDYSIIWHLTQVTTSCHNPAGQISTQFTYPEETED